LDELCRLLLPLTAWNTGRGGLWGTQFCVTCTRKWDVNVVNCSPHRIGRFGRVVGIGIFASHVAYRVQTFQFLGQSCNIFQKFQTAKKMALRNDPHGAPSTFKLFTSRHHISPKLKSQFQPVGGGKDNYNLCHTIRIAILVWHVATA
jgi:hypothetical protein